ncbi:MAG: hypothetical protein KAH38_05205 [Candidatus Hydrogenedentes bacterium]|nr:hypothetical protein [Candidatus Hydrogenedentota bacterium]
MDTDELSQEAYEILCLARVVCDPLCPELGVMAGQCRDENEWLESVLILCQELLIEPGEYLDEWGFADSDENIEHFTSHLQKMLGLTKALQAIGIDKRTFGK